MKRALGLGFAALLAAGCSSGPHYVVHRNAAHNWKLPPRSQIDKLRKDLVKSAKFDGEPHPTDGILVAGGHRCFFTDQGLAPGKTYLLAARGHFTLYDASHPPGAPVPTGTRIFFDVEGGHPEGFSDGGLLGERDHPERCGPWVSLDLGSN